MQISEVLQSSRYQHLNKPAVSIKVLSEKKALSTNNTFIELPREIKELITGNDYWVRAKTNRYLKLFRDGYGDLLLHVAAEARTKEHSANYFARAASKAMWERTLDYFRKLDEVAKKAAQVAEKLGTPVTKFIYKQIWRGVNVIRYAAMAKEAGRNPAKLFTWYCLHDKEMA